VRYGIEPTGSAAGISNVDFQMAGTRMSLQPDMAKNHPADGLSGALRPRGGRVWVLAVSLAMSAGCTNNETPVGGASGGATSGSTGGNPGAPSGGAAGRANTGGTQVGGYTQTGGVVQTGGAAQATGGVVQTGGTAQATGGAGTGGSRDAGAVDSGGGAGGAPLAPAQGALLGMYFGNGTMSATETKIGRKVAIHLVYYAWADDWTRGTKSDLDSGRIPLVNWEPAGIDFNDIVSGSLDATIDARASGARALGKPFFLDFAAEANGDEAWSGNNAALYVSAYRRIHDRFVAAGATNVVWAWCPNVTDTDGSNQNTMAYYPGDSYVDWTGVDGYNWGGSDWQSFQQVFVRIYPLLAAKGKPKIRSPRGFCWHLIDDICQYRN
jgi:hypothetical protein